MVLLPVSANTYIYAKNCYERESRSGKICA